MHGHVARAQHANITNWDEVKTLSDGELRARMFPGGRERKVPVYERADFDPQDNYGATLATLAKFDLIILDDFLMAPFD